MKHCCLLLLLCMMSVARVSAAPQIRWVNEIHNFGAFSEDLGTVECEFKGVNTGNEPLQVLSARANCGCTVPKYDREPIAPGDTVHIKVSFNAVGRPGRFDKKIYVYTNTNDDKSTLSIRGTVMGSQNTIKSRYPVAVGPIHIHSTIIPMGEVMKGHTGAAFIRAYNNSDVAVVPSVDNLPPYMKAEVKPQVVRPGEQFVISLTSFTGKCPTYGIVNDTIYVVPDSGSEVRMPVTTVITIKENFSKLTDKERKQAPKTVVSDEMLDFGRMSVKEGKVTRKFTVTNDGGGAPLYIRRAYTPAGGVTISGPLPDLAIAKGKTVTFEVTVNPSAISDSDVLNARITLITNDPDNPTKIIRVVGEL